jgi:hypothetical protein
VCAQCGTENAAGHKFCKKSKSALEGERKQVTVLFCDIANSFGARRTFTELDAPAYVRRVEKLLM